MSDRKFIDEMNVIIREWKGAYVLGLADLFLDEHIDRQELASKNWSDIIKISYELICNREPQEDKLPFFPSPRDYALVQNGLLASKLAEKGLRNFGENQDLYNFYNNTFGPTVELVEKIVVPDMCIRGNYGILPCGTKYNNGLPVSLRNITPRSIEVFAVSKNQAAHLVDDILIVKPTGSVVLKLVPELPECVLNWARQNNQKVY